MIWNTTQSILYYIYRINCIICISYIISYSILLIIYYISYVLYYLISYIICRTRTCLTNTIHRTAPLSNEHDPFNEHVYRNEPRERRSLMRRRCCAINPPWYHHPGVITRMLKYKIIWYEIQDNLFYTIYTD